MSAVLIPGYRIIKILGEGGMAKVYLAVQENFDRQVALKIMAPELAKSDPQYGERFLREARIVAQLMHPHIVTVFDVGTHEGLHYLSMEYVPGRDLRVRRESLTLKQNLMAVKQIATALDFAHKKGYIHRDIKPENILIHDQDGRAILTDFGIARIAGAHENLTQTGTAIGTPSFMSPEQALGKTIDHRSDLYSLGVVLFYVLTGKVPFTADSAVAIGLKHAVEPIPRLEGAFIQFQPVLEKAMAKQAEKRYQHGEEFAAVIEQMINKLSADTEQLWRESFGESARAKTETPAAAAQVISLNAVAKPKQPTPIVAQRATPKTVIAPPATPARRGLWLVLLVVLIAAGAVWQTQPEWLHTLLSTPAAHDAATITAASVPVETPAAPPPTPENAGTATENDLVATTSNAAPTDTTDTPSTTSNEDDAVFAQLTLAKQLLDAGDLIEPEAQNAESVYRAVLQHDSNNTTAKEGLSNVGIALATRGLRFAESGDLDRAQRDYERALLLAPRDRDVQLLKQRLALLARDKDAIDFITKAKAAIKNNRWLLPDGDNAQEYYARALAIQPANREAIAGSKELEQTIANRIRQLWQRKQFAEASDLLALAQKRYVASDVLDTVASQTVGALNSQRKANNNDNVSTLPAPAATLPTISELRVGLQTDPASGGKFLQASFRFERAADNTMLSAQIYLKPDNKLINTLPVKLTGNAGDMQFTVANLDDSFADGHYQLQMSWADKKIAEVGFSVGR